MQPLHPFTDQEDQMVLMIITTKQGVSGRPQINLNVSSGWAEMVNKIKMMTPEQYAQRQIDARNINWVRAGEMLDDPNSVRTSQDFMIPGVNLKILLRSSV